MTVFKIKYAIIFFYSAGIRLLYIYMENVTQKFYKYILQIYHFYT